MIRMKNFTLAFFVGLIFVLLIVIAVFVNVGGYDYIKRSDSVQNVIFDNGSVQDLRDMEICYVRIDQLTSTTHEECLRLVK